VARQNNRGGNLKPFYLLLGGIVVVGVGLMIYGARRKDVQAATSPVELQAMNATDLMKEAKGVRMGPDAAKVQVLVFSDYECPACAYLATNIEPLVRSEFVETGRIQYIVYDFPLVGIHQYSFLAARAGRCAEDQGKFWEYHELILGQQNSWAYSSAVPTDKFVSFAAQLGLNPDTFRQCLNSDAHAALVTANLRLGEDIGINETPTVFIDGRRIANPNDWDALKAEIQRALGD